MPPSPNNNRGRAKIDIISIFYCMIESGEPLLVLSAVNAEVVMEESPSRSSGGAESRGTFYRETSAEIVRRAARAGLRSARAEDAAPAAWLKFCKHFPDFAEDDAREHHRAWLLRAARHRIADAHRAKRRLRTCSLDALNKEPKDSHEQTCAKRARDDAHSFLLRC